VRNVARAKVAFESVEVTALAVKKGFLCAAGLASMVVKKA
jgi:hypothetical protein